MKKLFFAPIIIGTLTIIASGMSLTSCNTPAEKVENAQEKVNEAKNELNTANDAYLSEIESYRKSANEKISANEKSIAAFNERAEKEKKEVKADYKKKITELEQRNSDMKKKMDAYKGDGKENWEKFKAEFNHDMDELGNAFNDLTVKNVK